MAQLALARARDFDPSEPRDELGRWTDGGDGGDIGDAEPMTGFVSPNVNELNFGQAQAAVGSARQEVLRQAAAEIDQVVGRAPAPARDVIGAWRDGAENSLMMRMPRWSTAEARVALAMKGWLGDQKSALLFEPHQGGNAFMASFPAKGELADIHASLLKGGLAFHTLEPHPGGATVHVYGEDQATADAVGKAAQGYGGKASFTFGNGEFVGTSKTDGTDREQRDDARAKYEAVIAAAAAAPEFRGRDLARRWNDLRDRWGRKLQEVSGPEHARQLTGEATMAETPKVKANTRSIDEVAKQLNERTGKILARQFGVSSVTGPSPATDAFLADAIAQDLKSGLINGHSSPTWYSDKMAAAMKSAEQLHPEIATDPIKRWSYITSLAVTSQGETVDSNVRLAEVAYKTFKETGKFPTDVAAVNKTAINGNFAKVNAFIDKLGAKGTQDFFATEFTARDLKKETGFEVEKTKADAKVYGSAVLGPKIGQGFYQNLNGNFKPITMDMWFMRSWGRMTNTGIGYTDMKPVAARLQNALKDEGRDAPEDLDKLNDIAQQIYQQHERDWAKGIRDKKGELQYAAERFVYNYGGAMVDQPRGGNQRAWMTSVFNQALDKLKTEGINLEPASAQATWWNPEKVLFGHFGGRVKELDTDYAKSIGKLAASAGAKDFVDYPMQPNIKLEFGPWLEDPDEPDRMTKEQIADLAAGVERLMAANKSDKPRIRVIRRPPQSLKE
jgi:hypothetical protein